jgi:hypothetical protein
MQKHSTEVIDEAMEPAGPSDAIPGEKQVVTVFGVEYLHLHFPDGDDLYVTEYGRPWLGNLLPASIITDREWFRGHSVPLSRLGPRTAATSCSFKVRTKPWHGSSLDVVFKWNRMGQEVPGARDVESLWFADFNSPYEEFALLLEMRNTAYESPGRILTHKPLAIYVPHDEIAMERVGRKAHKMQWKEDSHADIALDRLRSYAVIYEWVKGVDAAHAAHEGMATKDAMVELTLHADAEMKRKGFSVSDRKPHHVIVRPTADGSVLTRREDEFAYALIDFELLRRTPERAAAITSAKRYAYLQEQAHRFDTNLSIPMPPHLKAVSILGVDYIYGHVESTGGSLWVVGKDPRLFDYFLPERWQQTPRTELSPAGPVYHTVTKDSIQLVWRLSRVGATPDLDPFRTEEKRILDHGYNSPFEEVTMSRELSPKCAPSTYPRAIYMTGHTRDTVVDARRFASHGKLRTPEDTPVLRRDRDYITIWGYWNKPDELLAREDKDYYHAIDALHALREGILDEASYVALMDDIRRRLLKCGIEDLNLRGSHILLSIDSGGNLVPGDNGLPEGRVCNFELLRRKRTDEE